MNQNRMFKIARNETAENYPSESTIGNQSARKSRTLSAAKRARAAAPSETGPSLHERIARKAYELYEQRGQFPGHDVDDWLEAEQVVRAEAHAENSPKGSRRRKRGDRAQAR